MMLRVVCVALLAMLVSVVGTARGAVMGVDLGSDSFKVAMIAAKTFDIVLNEGSGRKTPTLVSFDRRDVLQVGDDAKALMARLPQRTFGLMPDALGIEYGSAAGEALRAPGRVLLSWQPVPVISNVTSVVRGEPDGDAEVEAGPLPVARERFGLPVTRGILGEVVEGEGEEEEGEEFDKDAPATLPVEAGLALILAQAREMATASHGTPVRDAVVAVPPSWGQWQRHALADAADMAGLHLMGIVNAPSAAGVQWGLSKTFGKDKPAHMIVYDMGAGSTSASVLSFKGVTPDKKGVAMKKGALATQMEVEATAWDTEVGGRYFDERLVQQWLKEVEAAGQGDLSGNQRVVQKLVREAKKAKEVLSANTETNVVIEGLLDEYEFRTTVTRAQFEDLCADLIERSVAPLKHVINEYLQGGNADDDAAAGETTRSINDFAAIEIVGGGLRVPAVQAALEEYLTAAGRKPSIPTDDLSTATPSAADAAAAAAGDGSVLDRHLNGDEAVVLGAAFQCGVLSPTTQVTQYKAKDIIPQAVQVDILSDDGKVNKVHLPVFAAGARLGSKKSLSLSTTSNLTVVVRAVRDGAHGSGRVIRGPAGNDEDAIPATVYRVSGLPAKGKEPGAYNFTGTPKVTVTLRLEPTGIAVVEHADAEMHLEEWQRVLVKKKKTSSTTTTTTTADADADADAAASEEDATAGTAGDADDVSAGEASAEEAEPAAAATGDDGEAAAAAGEEDEKKDQEEEADAAAAKPEYTQKRVERVKRFACKLERRWSPALTLDDRREAGRLYRAIQGVRADVAAREAASNELETFIYASRDKLSDNEEWQAVTTEAQREELLERLAAASDWLDEEGFAAPARDLRAKLAELRVDVDAIELRAAEASARPAAAKRLTAAASLAEVAFGTENEEHDQHLAEYEAAVAAIAEAEEEAKAAAEAEFEAETAEAAAAGGGEEEEEEAAGADAEQAAPENDADAEVDAAAADDGDDGDDDDGDGDEAATTTTATKPDKTKKKNKPSKKSKLAAAAAAARAKFPKPEPARKYAIAVRQRMEDSEVVELLELAVSAKTWLEDEESKQAALQPHEEPVLLAADIEHKASELEKMIRRLQRRPVRKVAKKPKTVDLDVEEDAQEEEGKEGAQQEESSA